MGCLMGLNGVGLSRSKVLCVANDGLFCTKITN